MSEEMNFEAEAAEIAAPLVAESADMYDDEGLDFEPSGHRPIYVAACAWKPPFLLPAQLCNMCGINRGTTPSPWGDDDLLVCPACDKAFSSGESDEERRAEEAAEAYHGGYPVVLW